MENLDKLGEVGGKLSPALGLLPTPPLFCSDLLRLLEGGTGTSSPRGLVRISRQARRQRGLMRVLHA